MRALFVYGADKGSLWCEIKSSGNRYYRLAIRLVDGRCACECPHFQFRCRWSNPSIYEGKVCKHLTPWLEFLKRELHEIQSETKRGPQ
jgi:hypothetical protein